MHDFIRVGKTKFDDWLNGRGTPDALASNLFALKRRPGQAAIEESTYAVAGEVEEAEAVAAHLLADGRPRIESRYILRIREADLVEAGLAWNDRAFGTTGIIWVDFRHRDLVGPRDGFVALVGVLLRRLAEGQDRVRRLGAHQLRQALTRFQGQSPFHRPTHTANVIARALEDRPLDRLKYDTELARTELRHARVIEEAVRLRAHCLAERSRGAAPPEENWYRAEQELRDAYAEHYLREQLGSLLSEGQGQ